MAEETIARENLMNKKRYAPYCGDEMCSKGMPHTKWDVDKEQFVCKCGWVSKIAPDFILRYKNKWNL